MTTTGHLNLVNHIVTKATYVTNIKILEKENTFEIIYNLDIMLIISEPSNYV